jgi:hypothetical protein
MMTRLSPGCCAMVNLGSIEAATARAVLTAVQPAQVAAWVRGAGGAARAPVRPTTVVSA